MHELGGVWGLGFSYNEDSESQESFLEEMILEPSLER